MAGIAAWTEGCRVLELDPDLGAGIDPQDLELAHSACRGVLLHVPAGPWEMPQRELPDVIGFVIVGGLICREVGLRDRYMLELLGPNDVVQPPVVADRPRLGSPIAYTAAVDTGLIMLGDSFVRAGGRWPSLLTAIHRRLEAQRENLAIQGLIAHLARADHRLLLQLWHLADRWGRVTADGTVLPLPLTHELLGQLIGARRSTVTLAVTELESQGCITRIDDRGWLLTPQAEEKVAVIVRTGSTGRVLGDTFTFRCRSADIRDESRALRAQARQLRARRGLR